MPLVRIDMPAELGDAGRRAISDGVHQALVASFGIPDDDRFQIIAMRTPSVSIVRPDSFRGVTFSDDLVVIQITCADGRTIDQKRSLYAAIVENLARSAALRLEDVVINLVETKRENWSFGNGLATFA